MEQGLIVFYVNIIRAIIYSNSMYAMHVYIAYPM